MKSIKHYGIALLMLIMVSIDGHAQGTVTDATEIAALKDLYDNLAGASWTDNTNWPADAAAWSAITSVSQITGWNGITTTNGDITEVDLRSNNLTGTIPTSVGDLTELTTLHFSSNSLSGAIPSTINNLTNLVNLHLSYNQLTGSIPDLSALTNLVRLICRYNQLSGQIPTWVNSLTNVQNFDLMKNNLTGSIPAELGGLSNVFYVYLAYNQLTGVIPSELGNMSNLRLLDLGSNTLSGAIPAELGQPSLMTTLTLFNNQLTGAIPSELGDLTSLQYLQLFDNALTGTIPSSLGDLTALKQLYLYNNQLTGTLPSTLGTISSLQRLYIQSNQLEGDIPDGLVNITGFLKLLAYDNSLTSLPDFSSHANKANIDIVVHNNSIPYADIEQNFSTGTAYDFASYSYTGQSNNTPTVPVETVIEGNQLIIDTHDASTNNTYLWEKLDADEINWTDVTALNENATGDKYVKTITQTATETYRYTITNSLINQSKSATSITVNTSTVIDNVTAQLSYTFTYDDRSRLIERKVPGKGTEYIIYDKWDRALLTQNALLRADNKWQFVKYDKEHRPVMFGLYTNSDSTTRESMQAVADLLDYDNADQYYEVRQAATTHGYSESNSFPTTGLEIQSVNYYDDYDVDYNGTADYTYDTTHYTAAEASAYTYTRGLPTSSKTKILTTSNWLTSVYFYNEDGRIIQTQSNNQQNANLQDISTAVYNWAGELLKTKTTHTGATSITTYERYEYDHAGRLLEIYHTVNSQTEQLLTQYTYNELGQLIEKNLHDQGSSFLQSVDLQYNIRGWLTSINDADLSDGENDLFGMELQYNNASNAQYNGNIGAIKWNKSGDKTASQYDFSYDGINRLTTADHSQTTNTDGYDMTAAYDLNGNITGLNRYSDDTQVDQLSYTYSNNQLMQVADTQATAGFDDGNITGNDYVYDVNGNMTEDKNKGITNIVYNHMDLPTVVTFSDGRKIENTYGASGSKLTQKTYDTDGTTVLNTTDYVGAYLYDNNVLQYVHTSEGRVVKDAITNNWDYEYHLSDHLGNVRVMLTSAPETVVFNLNYENDAALPDDIALFDNTANIIDADIHDNTDTGSVYTKSQKLTGASGSIVGSVLTIPVKPGDKISAEVYAKYLSATATSNPAAAIGGLVLSAISGNTGTVDYEGAVNTSYGSTGSIISNPAYGNTTSSSEPLAFINLMFLPEQAEDSVLSSHFAYQQVSAASNGAHALLELSQDYVVPHAGYVVVYLSNESDFLTEVYFDDLTITVNQSNIIQANDYYPFGLKHATSWTRETSLKNNRLFNGGSELNELTKNYETFYRNYDPAIGRFNSIDIMATKYHSMSPYQFANNDPIYYNDPYGDDVASFAGGSDYTPDPSGSYFPGYGADIGESSLSGGGYMPNYSGYNSMFDSHWSQGIGVKLGGISYAQWSLNKFFASHLSTATTVNITNKGALSGYATQTTSVSGDGTWNNSGGGSSFLFGLSVQLFAADFADRNGLDTRTTGEAFVDGLAGGWNATKAAVKRQFTTEGLKDAVNPVLAMMKAGLAGYEAGKQIYDDLPNYSKNNYAYAAGFATEKLFEAAVLKGAGGLASGLTTTEGFLFRGFTIKAPFNIPVQRFGNMSLNRSDFWGVRIGTSNFANRVLSAIKPNWNPLTQYTLGVIPKGTLIKFGVIGPQGGRYLGGSFQFITPSRSIINQSTKIITR